MAWFDRDKYSNLAEAKAEAIAQAKYERDQKELLHSLEALAAERGVEELFGCILDALRQSFEHTDIRQNDAVFERHDHSEEVTVKFAQSSQQAGLLVRWRLTGPDSSIEERDEALQSKTTADRFANEILTSRFG